MSDDKENKPLTIEERIKMIGKETLEAAVGNIKQKPNPTEPKKPEVNQSEEIDSIEQARLDAIERSQNGIKINPFTGKELNAAILKPASDNTSKPTTQTKKKPPKGVGFGDEISKQVAELAKARNERVQGKGGKKEVSKKVPPKVPPKPFR